MIKNSMEPDKPKNNITLAAIDIGSNAARMLIKRLEKNNTGFHSKKLLFLRIPLRLGIDVFQEGRIGKEREKMLSHTMKVFSELITLFDIDDYLIYATSAFRDAKNGPSIIRQLKKDTNLDISVISGEEEACVIHDSFHADGNLLHVDVGGGSTELSLVCDGTLVDSRSVNIGTIRLLKKTVTHKDWSDLFSQVRMLVQGVDNLRIVGSGGNINKLARLASNVGVKHYLSVDNLKRLYSQMASISVEERMVQYDLSESRADVIVPAAQIFIMVAHLTMASDIIVPNVGLVDGMICRMAQQAWG